MFAFGVCLLHTEVSRVCLPLEFVCFILRYPGLVCLFGIVCSTLKCTLNTAVFTVCLLFLNSLWYDEFVYFILRCPLFAFHGLTEVRRDCLSRLFGGPFFVWTVCGTSKCPLNTGVSRVCLLFLDSLWYIEFDSASY